MVIKGEVYAFETDTVWGFGADINDKIAIDKIYELKNRDRSKPLILMSNKVENVLPYVETLPLMAISLIENHFPGALTLIIKKTALCPNFLNPEFASIAIRIPSHSGFCKFCEKNNNLVMATTSANISTEPPCENAQEVANKFSTNVKILQDYALGLNSGKASTIVAFEGEDMKILRQGDVII